MSTPMVSIIIPTYNHARFLGRALQAVLDQTMGDWEAIVIDNFSADDTAQVMQNYADPRIRHVLFANQGVIAVSRNHGISLTRAPYVAFLDSDDWWHPDKLALSLAKLEQGADLTCHAETWVGPGSLRREVSYGPSERSSYDSLLFNGNCISTSAVVVRRQCLFDAGCFSTEEAFNTAEDYDLWLKLARNGARMEFLPEVLGEYLLHDANHSRSHLRNMNAVMAVFEHHLQGLGIQAQDQGRVIRRRSLIYYSGARTLHLAKQFSQANEYYWKALRHYPGRAQTWAGMLLNALRLSV